jgi:ATP-dependent DNA helicase DinG
LLRARHAYNGKVEAACNALRERARAFFAALPAGDGPGRMAFANREAFLEESGDVYMAVTSALQRLEHELGWVKDVDEAEGLAERAEDIRTQLEFLLESDDANVVFWIERRMIGGLRAAARAAAGTAAAQAAFHTHLQATPIDISGLLGKTLFTEYKSVVLTSATLTVENSFQHVRGRLGLQHARELIVPSHFDYAKQALLYLPTGMPDPNFPEFVASAAERTRRVLEITRGRAFCLFTSRRMMQEVYERLLSELPFPLLVQGSAPRQALLEEFRRTPNAVLFGTASFWHGVDVQGEQLSCVIVDRLPFGVPTDPVVMARMHAIEESGGRPFFDYQVPGAVIALKQGFGRLIRSLTDRGVLVLLDPRIQTKSYGRIFLESLPPYRLTQDITEVESFFAGDEAATA